MQIRDLMISTPITITANAPISRAIELMKVNSIRHLPVTGEGNKTVGFVTLADLRTGAYSLYGRRALLPFPT